MTRRHASQRDVSVSGGDELKDHKIKTAAAKAPLGVVPQQALIGPARVFGYGGRKYVAGNFYNADLSDGAGQRYVSAALRHLAEMQEPNGLHTPESLAALDPESGLPHIDHVLCGLMMLRTIMVKCGALPADPGIGNEPPQPEAKHEIGTCNCRDCCSLRTQTTCDLALLSDAVPEPIPVASDLPRLAAEVRAEFEQTTLEHIADVERARYRARVEFLAGKAYREDGGR